MSNSKRKRAFSVFEGRVEWGGTRREAEFLAGLFRVDGARAVFATHRFHPYAARMPPSIARDVIARYGGYGKSRGRQARHLIYDPFCGSGTVLVEALVAGLRAAGSDASPLAVELARVRTTPLSPARRERMVALGEAVALASAERAMRRVRLAALPDWVELERPHFETHVLLELLGLRACLQEASIDDREVARALWMCLSSCLLKWRKEVAPLSRTGTERSKDPDQPIANSRRLRARAAAPSEHEPRMRRIGRGVPSRFFARRVRELATALAELEQAGGGAEAPAIEEADARTLGHVGDDSVALCVTSPPYAGVYDYARLHETRYRFLGIADRGFRGTQIGAPTGRGVHSRAFGRDRDAFMSAIARILAPGGHVCMVVGDGVLDGMPENARETIADAGRRAGLRPIAYASQTRPPRESRLRAIFAETPRYEHILLLGKSS